LWNYRDISYLSKVISLTDTNPNPSSMSTTTLESDGSEPSHPPLNQVLLQESFINAGSRLQSSNPDLFANAIQQLFQQFSLAVVKNPKILRSSTAVSHDSSCSSEGVSGRIRKREEHDDSCEHKNRSYRKYTLPGDMDKEEYYQCMTCKERRRENSFQANHTHLGQKPRIRWYCPLCKAFFAVTHRSGHIKKRHSPSSETKTEYSPEDIEKTVAMIASATVAAVVSAANCSSPPRVSSEDSCSIPTVKQIKEELKEEEDEEEEERGSCYIPEEKRTRYIPDEQDSTFDYGGCSSATALSSPPNQFSESVDDDSETSSFLFGGESSSYLPTLYSDADTTDPLFPNLY